MPVMLSSFTSLRAGLLVGAGLVLCAVMGIAAVAADLGRMDLGSVVVYKEAVGPAYVPTPNGGTN